MSNLKTLECSGEHHYFVAQDASYQGKVFILLVCTACGDARKVEFEVAPPDVQVAVQE